MNWLGSILLLITNEALGEQRDGSLVLNERQVK
jgi:hypothetical protein